MRYLGVFCLLVWSLGLSAQFQSLEDFASQNASPYWYLVNPDQAVDAQSLVQQGHLWGLTPSDQLVLEKTSYDEIGFEHRYFALYHQGQRVEHTYLAFHSYGGSVKSFNFFLPHFVQAPAQLQIDEGRAINAALAYIPAQEYLWEVPFFEKMIQQIKADSTASFYPKAELMWVDTDYDWQTTDYRLAYRLEIFTAMPHGSWQVYVDAITGLPIKKLSMMHSMDSHGVAETRYSGTRDIITDSTGTDFR
ncbi:MAG: hypothetical protein AAFQ68_23055, partial [Bacteroidota bacterium]